MREVKEILMIKPFNLAEEDASILSRYIVEDVEGEYVYSDEGNEQKREVVKSIVKNLIDDYEIPTKEV